MKDEYKDLSDNMRHYGNMRFAQLTLYFGLTAALITGVFVTDPPLDVSVRTALKIFGAISALAFAVMEERATDYWRHFRRRAVRLESEMGYKQYSSRPETCLICATNAVRLLIWCTIPLWLLATWCRL